MTTPDRRARLRELYGLDFPDDLFRFWEFATRLRPLEPLLALSEPLGIRLVGPFEVLAGRFDRRTPRYSILLHWRYHDDPPEFFTALAGGEEGLHWGYYLDDPAAGPGCVAHYYTGDDFEMSTDGDTLFEAARLHLEYVYQDCLDSRDEEEADAAAYEARAHELEKLRGQFLPHATADRPEVGGEYTDLYDGLSARSAHVVARTMEGMGVVVPRKAYRPLSLSDKKLWARLRKDKGPEEVVEEARQALRDGFPGTALKLGKDLWATTGKRRTGYALELLEAAYGALGREALLRVLKEHREHRDLPTVDVLEAEGSGNGEG